MDEPAYKNFHFPLCLLASQILKWRETFKQKLLDNVCIIFYATVAKVPFVSIILDANGHSKVLPTPGDRPWNWCLSESQPCLLTRKRSLESREVEADRAKPRVSRSIYWSRNPSCVGSVGNVATWGRKFIVTIRYVFIYDKLSFLVFPIHTYIYI